MIVAGIIMALLVVTGRTVPGILAWIFFAGTAVTLISSLFAKRKNNKS